MKDKLITYIFATFTILFFSSMSIAGGYLLTEGKDIRFCQEYKENLNSFDSVEYRPMRCERKISDHSPELKSPIWTQIEPEDSWEYIKITMEFLSPGQWRENDIGFRNFILGRFKRRSLTVKLSEIDIDNDGEVESILRYEDGNCELEAGLWAAPLVVLNKGKASIDAAKTEKLAQNKSRRDQNKIGRWGYAMYGVILYRENTYFDRWSDDESEKGILDVYQLKGANVKKFCEFKYQSHLYPGKVTSQISFDDAM
ncbi:MAG: hypothetical protein GY820_42745 [Gammaproteobacteria bacterium]|nr:hypothetical protein [Gammaproteobacteria bacterium]